MADLFMIAVLYEVFCAAFKPFVGLQDLAKVAAHLEPPSVHARPRDVPDLLSVHRGERSDPVPFGFKDAAAIVKRLGRRGEHRQNDRKRGGL